MNINQIIPPRVPLIDLRTGQMDRAWYLFFVNFLTAMVSAEATLEGVGQSPSNYTEVLEPLQSLMAIVQTSIPELNLTPANSNLIQQDQLVSTMQSVPDLEDLRPVQSFGSMAQQNTGITTTIDTGTLVGKTITVINGIITNFA